MTLIPIVMALWAAAAPPPPSRCAGGEGGFDFEGGTQGAWTETFSALAFDHLTLDTTRAQCGRSSLRMRANFSPTGLEMPTLHRAYEVGEVEMKPAALMDFTDMTVEAGILLDGPTDVRLEAFLLLVSDGKWVPGGLLKVTPGQWTTVQHHFGAENSLGPKGGTASVQRVFKIAIAVVCAGCRWSGHLNVDAIRWYRGAPAPGVAVAAAPAPAAASPVAPAPAPVAPPATLVALRFWARNPGRYHVAVNGPVSATCEAPCILKVAPGPNTINISGDVTLAETMTVPAIATAVEIKPGDQPPAPPAPAPPAVVQAAAAPPPAVEPLPGPPPVALVPPPPPTATDTLSVTAAPPKSTEADPAEFSGSRFLVESLSAALAGPLTLYLTLRGICGNQICLGGAFAASFADVAVTDAVVYGVGSVMGGEGTFGGAVLGTGIASSSLASVEIGPGTALVILSVLMPFTTSLMYEVSSNITARDRKLAAKRAWLTPFMLPTAAGGVAGFVGRF